jgi:hypothetical protein
VSPESIPARDIISTKDFVAISGFPLLGVIMYRKARRASSNGSVTTNGSEQEAT